MFHSSNSITKKPWYPARRQQDNGMDVGWQSTNLWHGGKIKPKEAKQKTKQNWKKQLTKEKVFSL